MADFQLNIDKRKLQDLIDNLPGGIDDLLNGVAIEMVADMQLGMDDSPADGVTYTRGSVQHTASSPGNPPRPDTAALRNSITHTSTGTHEVTIHDQVEYGQYQEFGTETIEARPWMKPVFEDWRRNKFNNFVDNFSLVK